MKETFPDKKKGEHLHHEKDWNKIAGTVQRLANQLPGSNLSGIHTGSFSSTIGYNPWHQYIVEVMSQYAESSLGNPISGLYLCRVRYYDHQESVASDRWKRRGTLIGGPGPSAEDTWLLDARDLDIRLEIGDKLVVMWSAQRRAFLPFCRDDLACVADFRISQTNEGSPPGEYLSQEQYQLLDPCSAASAQNGGGFSDIGYILESTTESTSTPGELDDWEEVNGGRFCEMNGRVGFRNEVSDNIKNSSVSGSVFYTFAIKEDTYLRVRAWSSMSWASVRISGGNMRIESYRTDLNFFQVHHTELSPQGPVVRGCDNEATIDMWETVDIANQPSTTDGVYFREDEPTLDNTFKRRPIFTNISPTWTNVGPRPNADDGTMKITLPKKETTEGESNADKYWLIKISLDIRFEVAQATGDNACIYPPNVGLPQLPGAPGAAGKHALIVDENGCLDWMPIEPC